MSRARVIASVIMVMGAVAFVAPARGAAASSRGDEAIVDARAFGGFGSGLGLSAWLPGRHLRIDVATAVAVGTADVGAAFIWTGIGAVVPLVRKGPSFAGVRAGYDLEYFWNDNPSWQGSRFAQVPDVGLVARAESARGSSIEAEAGVEAVLRAQSVTCCDSTLPSSSLGARLALKAEWALSPTWALFAQLGLRTASHVLDIKVLPLASAGIRARF